MANVSMGLGRPGDERARQETASKRVFGSHLEAFRIGIVAS